MSKDPFAGYRSNAYNRIVRIPVAITLFIPVQTVPRVRRLCRWSVLSVLGILALTACAPVGPDFVRPAPPQTTVDGSAASSGATVGSAGAFGAAQHFSTGNALQSGAWWQQFGSPKLDALIASALQNNPSIEAATAALANAREFAVAQSDNLLVPSVDAQAGQTREKISTAAFGLPGNSPSFSLTNVSVNVGYTLDFFGANRRKLEGLAAQTDMQAWLLQGARQTLAANIVTTALLEAGLRSTIDATQAIVADQRDLLQILSQRAALGAVSETDVQNQRALWAQAKAGLPPLNQQLAQARHQLAAYLGKTPNAQELPEFHLADFTLPVNLPLSVPSQLVRQRPDILASEAQWHQATASLGMTIASVYPNITLSAGMGAMALQPGNVFNAASSVWNLGTNITQPLFHGGALIAEQHAAEAALQQSAALYRQTVIAAFQNVADVLQALHNDALTLEAQTQNATAYAQNLSRAQAQLALGALGYPELLGAKTRAEQAHVAQTQAQVQRLSDTAALYLALGGSWQPPLPANTAAGAQSASGQ